MLTSSVRFVFRILFPVIIVCSSQSAAEIILQKEKNVFSVTDLRGFMQDVFVQGYSDKEDFYRVFFNSFQEISGLEFYQSNDGKSWEKVKLKNLKAEDASYSSFYNGLKNYRLVLLKNYFFRIYYKTKCAEIKILSSFDLKNFYTTDTLENSIHISKSLVLSWLYKKNSDDIKIIIDSSETASAWSYSFNSYFDKAKGVPYENLCNEKVYCSVHDRGISPEEDLNSWFMTLFKPVNGLSETSKSEIKKIAAGISDTLEITKKIYDYVKKSVSYIDIESGYGAWQPRKADNILLVKKGDCKDMANLIFQSLRCVNIESYLAMMPTLSLADDFIFPSLSCANHMICVAHTSAGWQFLDATDEMNEFEMPSRHSQDRTVFCFSENKPFRLKIPAVDPEKNTVTHHIVIEPSLNGEWKMHFSGHSASNIFDIINSYSEDDIKEYFAGYFKKIAPKIKVLDYSYDKSQPGTITCTLHFQLPASAIFNDGAKQYLSLKYFPFPTGEAPEKKGCRHIHYNTECNKYHISFKLSKPVKLLNSRSEKAEEEKMFFSLNIVQASDREINIDYKFQSPYVIYDTVLFSSYEKIFSTITKSFNNLVTYE